MSTSALEGIHRFITLVAVVLTSVAVTRLGINVTRQTDIMSSLIFLAGMFGGGVGVFVIMLVETAGCAAIGGVVGGLLGGMIRWLLLGRPPSSLGTLAVGYVSISSASAALVAGLAYGVWGIRFYWLIRG